MRSISRFIRFTAVAAVIASIFAGCLSYTVDFVEVSIDGNADTIDAGKSIQFNFNVAAQGKDTSNAQRVNWSVSSTSDGKGPVTPGTTVSPSGTLSVSIDEIYPILYVRATHAAYSGKYDFKQINVKGPKVGSVVISTAAASVVAGGTVKLSAFVAGQAPNQGLTYSVGSKSDGTGAVAAGSAIAGDGTLTVAAGETASSLYVKAQSNSDATKSAIQEIKIITVTSVTVTADGGTARVLRGGSLKFAATVAGNNGPGQNVTWKVSANQAGTSAVTDGTAIAADGTLTVAATEAAATLYVTATSAVDTTKSGSLAVVIPTVTAVTVSPVNPQIKRGDGVTFTARVQGTGSPGQEVTWKLDGVGGTPSATTITSTGMLVVSTAEMLSGLIVTATSVDDPAKFGTSMVTIPAIPAAIDTFAGYSITGSGTSFTARKSGASVGAVNQPIQTVIDAIRNDAKGAACQIRFGNGSDVLNTGTASIIFNNTGGTWGAITLSGKITSAVNVSGNDNGTIVISDNISITSTADIANTDAATGDNANGKAITHNSTGTLTINGGRVSSVTGKAIVFPSLGTVTVSGGTVASTSGIGIQLTGRGTINVSGNGLVTAAGSGSTIGCTLIPDSSGTINVTGGTVENTGSGSTIYMFSGVKINISGGTVKSTSGIAINRQGTGPVVIDGNAVVSATSGRGVHSGSNGGTVTIAGNAKVSATTGYAVYTYVSSNNTFIKGNAVVSATTGYALYIYYTGAVNISENAKVTSANTNAAQGTVFLGKQTATADPANLRLEITGGTVENTAANGNAIRNNSTGGITVSGGTVSAPSGIAINNTAGAALDTTGGKIVGKVSP